MRNRNTARKLAGTCLIAAPLALTAAMALAPASRAPACGRVRRRPPTVRAALQHLVLTGLLRREANRSAFVPELGPDDIADLFSMRTLIETEAVRRLAKATAPPGRTEQAVGRLDRFTEDASWSDVVEADLEFHRSLVAATQSPRLLRLFELLEDEIRLAIAQLRPAYASPTELARDTAASSP